MAERRPLVLVNGQPQQLATGDTLPAMAPATHGSTHYPGGSDPANALAWHGFFNRTSSSLSMSGSTFQITTATSYDFYVNGVKFSKNTTQTVSITADQAMTWIYYDSSGVLQKSLSKWEITDTTAIPVATVYKDGSTYDIGDERHAYNRSLPWHDWAHDTIGARYHEGLTGTFTNTTLSIVQGIIQDEDIHLDTGGTKTTCALWYRNPGLTGMRIETGSSTPYKADTGTLQYDLAGTLTPIATTGGGRYAAYWVYATNSTTNPIAVVVSQAEYASLAAAQAAVLPSFPGMTTLEWKLIYRLIYRNVSGTATFIQADDYRLVSSGPPSASGSAATHAALAGRDAADQHPASSIANTPAGNIAATTVQSAIDELDSEKVPTTRTITATAPLTIAGTTSADLSADRTIAISAATTGEAGSMSAADKTKLDGIASGAIADIVNDTTPQLGGNLDVNGKTITSASNGNITITPNGTGATDFGDSTVKQAWFRDYGEIVNALGSVSGNPVDIDLTAGNVVTATIGGATTLTVSNPTATGKACSFVLILTNGGSATVTWFSGAKWPGGTAPTLTASGVDVLVFTTVDAGTTWRGVCAQLDSK